MGKIWKAKWIMDKDFFGLTPINVFKREMDKVELTEHREDLKNRHVLFRKEFVIYDTVDNAYMDITADDYYKLYINGCFVGQGPATAYYFHYHYNRFDITPFLKKGKNIIAVHVYYMGLINRAFNSGDYRQGLIAEVVTEDRVVLTTDSAWKYKVTKAFGNGHVIGARTQFAENIDMRLMEKGWKETGFDDSKWVNAFESITDDHKLFMQPTPPLKVYEIKPFSITKLEKGRYLIDFGHEVTGQFKMSATGKNGQVIDIRCAEEMDEEKKDAIRYNTRCNCLYQEK
jgi:alpha-L-rhamnosidase